MDRWWTGYVCLNSVVSVLCVKFLVSVSYVGSVNSVAVGETRVRTTFINPDSRMGHGPRVRRGTDPGKLPGLINSMLVQFDLNRPIAALWSIRSEPCIYFMLDIFRCLFFSRQILHIFRMRYRVSKMPP